MAVSFHIHYIKRSRVVKRQCGFFCRRKGNVMENLYEIIGKLLAAFVVGLLAYLTPKAKAWLEAHTDAAAQENIRRLVRSFARAAEQLYHDQDPSGEKRQQFVQEQLRAMGVAVTEAVINMIEGAVWEINTENKKALVQAGETVSGGVE